MKNKYNIIHLDDTGNPEVSVAIIVNDDDTITFDPPDMEGWITSILSNTDFIGPGDTEGPIDIKDPESLKRLPYVFHGHRVWCEIDEE